MTDKHKPLLSKHLPQQMDLAVCVCACACACFTHFHFWLACCLLKITPILYNHIWARLLCVRKRLSAKESCFQALQNRLHPHQLLFLCVNPQTGSQSSIQKLTWSTLFAMHLTDLNQECLLHLFSFLDKNSRQNLSLTCQRLRVAFLDPQLWSLLNFFSPSELTKNNFILGPFLRYLNICWHSSRVRVCNIEDYKKTTFQRDLCSKHASLVSHFLEHVCHTWVLLFCFCVIPILSVSCFWSCRWEAGNNGIYSDQGCFLCFNVFLILFKKNIVSKS